MQWNQASADWHTTRAENDVRAGGRFLSRMEAKDDSMGFDFSGVYTAVKTNENIAYMLDDGRRVNVNFEADGNQTKVVETFEAESEHSEEMQQAGWEAIMDNFKKYAESNQ